MWMFLCHIASVPSSVSTHVRMQCTIRPLVGQQKKIIQFNTPLFRPFAYSDSLQGRGSFRDNVSSIDHLWGTINGFASHRDVHWAIIAIAFEDICSPIGHVLRLPGCGILEVFSGALSLVLVHYVLHDPAIGKAGSSRVRDPVWFVNFKGVHPVRGGTQN